MSKDGASKNSKGMYGFDPSGLERAAAAAKYLDQSSNSKNAFELATKKEETMQLETKKALKDQEIQRVQIEQDERRRTMQMDMQLQKEKSQYDDQLAKQRIEYRLSRERESQEDNLRKQEDSLKKQEDMKRATMQYEHELKVYYSHNIS